MKTGLRLWRNSLLAIAVVTMLLSSAGLALAADASVKVFPAKSTVYGMTYDQWSARWWQWAFGIPTSQSPLIDETGANCAVGQSGPVWFLAGTFTSVETAPGHVVGRANRTCQIPAEKAILIPVINAECSDVEGNGNTKAELRACARDVANHITEAKLTVDGVEVPGLTPPDSKFRVTSPLFPIQLPEDNLLGVTTLSGISVADGYWVMLKPLPAGTHTVHIQGVAFFPGDVPENNFTFQLDIQYELIVNE